MRLPIPRLRAFLLTLALLGPIALTASAQMYDTSCEQLCEQQRYDCQRQCDGVRDVFGCQNRCDVHAQSCHQNCRRQQQQPPPETPKDPWLPNSSLFPSCPYGPLETPDPDRRLRARA